MWPDRAWNRMVRGLGAAVLVFVVLAAVTPLCNSLAGAFVQPAAIEPADAIVVISASLLADGTLNHESLRRTLHAVDLYQKGLAPLIVFSGGTRDVPTEAVLRTQLARGLGVPAEAILREESANTTREESTRIGRLLLPRPARRILLVTHTLHMRRARLVFERAGFQVLAAPSDEDARTLSGVGGRFWLMYRMLQEGAALFYYKAAGYV